MESVLGRTAFHRVFDYMRELAAVRDPGVWETSMLEYFTRRVDDPSAVKQAGLGGPRLYWQVAGGHNCGVFSQHR